MKISQKVSKKFRNITTLAAGLLLCSTQSFSNTPSPFPNPTEGSLDSLGSLATVNPLNIFGSDQSGAESSGSGSGSGVLTGVGAYSSGSLGSQFVSGPFASESGSFGSASMSGLAGSGSAASNSLGPSPFLSASFVLPTGSLLFSSGWAFGSGIGGVGSGFDSIASLVRIGPGVFGIGSFGSLVGFDSMGSTKIPAIISAIHNLPAAFHTRGLVRILRDILRPIGSFDVNILPNSLGVPAGIQFEGNSFASTIAPSLSLDYFGNLSFRSFSSLKPGSTSLGSTASGNSISSGSELIGSIYGNRLPMALASASIPAPLSFAKIPVKKLKESYTVKTNVVSAALVQDNYQDGWCAIGHNPDGSCRGASEYEQATIWAAGTTAACLLTGAPPVGCLGAGAITGAAAGIAQYRNNKRK